MTTSVIIAPAQLLNLEKNWTLQSKNFHNIYLNFQTRKFSKFEISYRNYQNLKYPNNFKPDIKKFEINHPVIKLNVTKFQEFKYNASTTNLVIVLTITEVSRVIDDKWINTPKALQKLL